MGLKTLMDGLGRIIDMQANLMQGGGEITVEVNEEEGEVTVVQECECKSAKS